VTQTNIEFIEGAVAAFNRGDQDAGLEAMAPSFELDLSRATGPFKGVYGPEAVRGFLDEFWASWETLHVKPLEFIEAGDLTVVPVRLQATGRGGIEVTARPTWVWTIRDGAIERMVMYQEREDALADLP